LDLESIVKFATVTLAQAADGGAALVVGLAIVRGAISFIGAMLGLLRGAPSIGVPREEIRLDLGRSLALALEFEVGADILRTAVTPTWADILQLGAIILLRTVLNYFLQRELDNAARRAGGLPGTQPAPSGAPPA
jgi:uncharacterized membrane protein